MFGKRAVPVIVKDDAEEIARHATEVWQKEVRRVHDAVKEAITEGHRFVELDSKGSIYNHFVGAVLAVANTTPEVLDVVFHSYQFDTSMPEFTVEKGRALLKLKVTAKADAG